MSDQPVARPLRTHDNTTQKDTDKHPCLERDSNPRSQQPTSHDRTATVTDYNIQYWLKIMRWAGHVKRMGEVRGA
jgi:hypothetical protein